MREEWREAQRIALDSCLEIHPLSKAELKLVRDWIDELVSAADIMVRLRDKRAEHDAREVQYRQMVDKRRADKKAAKAAYPYR